MNNSYCYYFLLELNYFCHVFVLFICGCHVVRPDFYPQVLLRNKVSTWLVTRIEPNQVSIHSYFEK